MAVDVISSAYNAEGGIGDTLIGTLRKTYGPRFAEACHDDEKLRDALEKMDEPSLRKLMQDQDEGKLEQICRQAT